MIIYFSGTGNSKFVAEYLADKLEDSILSLNKVIKNGEKLVCTSEKPYIIVAPIYAWRFPGKIEEILNLMIPELHNPDFNTILVL